MEKKKIILLILMICTAQEETSLKKSCNHLPNFIIIENSAITLKKKEKAYKRDYSYKL